MEPYGCFTLKMDCSICDSDVTVVWVWISDRHWDSTVQQQNDMGPQWNVHRSKVEQVLYLTSDTLWCGGKFLSLHFTKLCFCLGKCKPYSYDIIYECSRGFFVFGDQWCTNPRHQLTMATKFFKIAPNICGSSVWNLLCVTILAPKIWRCLQGFWKICVPLLLTFFL